MTSYPDGAAAAVGWVPAEGPGDERPSRGRPFDWFGGPGADDPPGDPPQDPPDDPSDNPPDDPPDDPPDGAGGVALPAGPGPSGPMSGAAASPVGSSDGWSADRWSADRWREYAADRAPLSLRGAARVPLAAAVAALLVAVAVVAGAVLRTTSSGAEAVAVARPSRSGVDGPTPTGPVAVGAPGTDGFAGPSADGTGTGARGAGPSAAGTAAATVVVDVVGRVRRPGLVRLPPGSRVADAVSAAGGLTDAAAVARINLARVLVDGEQVVVPDADDPVPPPAAAPGAAGGPGASATKGATGPLDLNAATSADLDGLPGIGPVIAGRIVAWRSEHGRFARVEELAEVSGIGDTLLERLRPLVRV